jgi:hypothetical protein
MNKLCIVLTIVCVFLLEHTGSLFADNVMMCTIDLSSTAHVFKVTDDGDIIYDYSVQVCPFPANIEFAPNGKWGLVGGDTPPDKPETQVTTILTVDENRRVSYLGSVHNENGRPVAISPDSKYGVYGSDLKSLRYNSKTQSYTILSSEDDNPSLCMDIDFTVLTGNLLGRSNYVIKEYEILSNGRIGATGYELDITPSRGSHGIYISPDGWTSVVCDLRPYSVTVLRLREPSGYSIVQQFDAISLNPYQADFTPDSKYAVISFYTSEADLRTYSIGYDSKLTLVDTLNLPNKPGECMAVTLDGKYIITRGIYQGKTYFYVVRLNEDGTMEYLPAKDYVINGYVSAIEFVPQSKTDVGNSWLLYE